MSTHAAVLEVDGLVAITVTFHPDHGLLASQQAALGRTRSIVVDNGSGEVDVAGICTLVNMSDTRVLVTLPRNVGLAAGLNAGIDRARAMGASAVLLLDQDSTFPADTAAHLLDALNEVQSSTGRLACIGPRLVDVATGMPHGFHHIADGWRWAQSSPSATPREPFPVDNLNGSGAIMSMALVDQVGRLDDNLFIDHVDTDWAFRVKRAGFGLFGVPWVTMDHRMGETGRRVWLLGWRVWPERSPRRHYYLFRNTIALMKRPYVPTVWKVWATLKLALTVLTAMFDPRRLEQWRMMLSGARDGRSGRMGPAS